jgi:transcriptional regulator with XRE-family HTH domain
MKTKTASRRKKISSLPKIRLLREAMHLPRKTFSRLIGFSERAVAEWESGNQAPNELAQRRLQELDRLQAALKSVVTQETIPVWMNTPNQAFGGLKPLEVIERGETDRLWRMIFFLESGVAS